MLFPERMLLAEIACAPEVFQDIIDILHHSESAEIENSSVLAGQPLKSRFVPDNSINEVMKMKARFEHVLDHLDASYSSGHPAAIPVSGTMEYAGRFLHYTEEIDETFAELHSIETDLASEKLRHEFISWLTASGIDTTLCRSSERIDVICGVIRGNPPVIHEDNTDDIIISASHIRDMTFMIITAQPESDVADTIRKSADFTPVDCTSPLRDIDSLESIRKGLDDVVDSYIALIPELQSAHTACETYLSAAEQISRCTDTDYCSHIACWIPEKTVQEISEELRERFRDRYTIRLVHAETAIKESVFTNQSVPSRLVPSRILEPFRVLVSSYSWPVYGNIDPTVLSAIFFLIFFGIMFADVGHGAVIFLIGVILRIIASGRTVRNAGMLMIYSGASAVTGGFLFGSFFGREDIIEPLLFSPSEHIGTFLSVGIAIGVFVLSAGIILNTIQTVRNRGMSDAFFSQWGLFSLIFYWLCVWIAGASFSPTVPEPSFPLIISIIAVPLVIMTAGDLIMSKVRGRADIAETAFRPVELALGLLSNTVSFVRIAAFGLCHIALMNAVYIIASSQPDSQTYFISVSIEGNIFVILLESLIVTIQCVRLQFYEFYSKFFSPGGRRFAPIGSISDTGE